MSRSCRPLPMGKGEPARQTLPSVERQLIHCQRDYWFGERKSGHHRRILRHTLSRSTVLAPSGVFVAIPCPILWNLGRLLSLDWLLVPALKSRNRYPASKKWYAFTSKVGVQIGQADSIPGVDHGLREVPGHSNHFVLWLSNDLHHACARRLHA